MKSKLWRAHFFLFLLTILIFPCALFSQQSKVDSLERLLQNAKHDTTRLRLYLALGDACNVKDNLKYAEPAVQLADKLFAKTSDQKLKRKLLKQKSTAFGLIAYYYQNKSDSSKILEYELKRLSIYQEIQDTANIIRSFVELSVEYSSRGNFPTALEYLEKGLSISKEMNYKEGIAAVLFQLGTMYANQGDRKQALVNYEKSISIFHELKDTAQLAYSYIMIGNIQGKENNTSKAFGSFNKGISFYNALRDEDNVMWAYNCVGNMYSENNDFANALLYFQKSLSMAEKMNNTYWVAVLLGNIGNTYLKQADFEKALEYHYKALKINRGINDDSRKAWSFDCLARTYFEQKNYGKAKSYSDSALVIWRKRVALESICDGDQLAARIDSALGNGASAFEHYKEYIFLRDQFSSDEVQKAATKEKFQDEYDKRKAAEKAEQDKKDAIALGEKRKQKIFLWAVSFGLVLVLVFAGFIFRSLRITRKQNQIIEIKSREIEEKNREITDSINYAERIQRALLASEKLLQKNLKNYFLLFKPKDIVSGDFYWAAELSNGNFALVTADSTGHGVPGAIMSMLNISSLDKAINAAKLLQPSEILNHTRQTIISTLANDGSIEGGKDGMDASLISFDLANNKITYAAANNPVWVIRNSEFIPLLADRMPIGKHQNDQTPFVQHEFQLQKGDFVYAFSDGFADQFGGPHGKKFKYKQLEKLLLSMVHESLDIQKQKLAYAFESWKGNLEQVDDVCVIGVKI